MDCTTGGQDGHCLSRKKLEFLVDEYSNRVRASSNLLTHPQKILFTSLQHQSSSALFWASQLLSMSAGSNPDDVLRFAEALYLDGQYMRAAFAIQSRELDKKLFRGCYLAAKALAKAKDPDEALAAMENGEAVLLAEVKRLAKVEEGDERAAGDLRKDLSSFFLLKGQILESLDNRGLAVEAYKEALKVDVFCSEAFSTIIQHQMLSAEEEKELIHSLPFVQHCNRYLVVEDDDDTETGEAKTDSSSESSDEAEYVSFLYTVQLKKYHKPEQMLIPTKFREMALTNNELLLHQSERYFYNCDYQACFQITSSLMKNDPYNGACLPIHVSCLIELEKPNELFHLAHKLVDLFPDWAGKILKRNI